MSVQKPDGSTAHAKVIVVGMGEIGTPLFQLIDAHHNALAVDLEPITVEDECETLHICIPFKIDDFVGECVRYIKKYAPALTIVNSTVAPGTTRRVAEASGSAVVHSPVRGKHANMKADMLFYTRFIGGLAVDHSEKAAAHFAELGVKTKILNSPEETEVAKLTETTYFGLLIAWAQEVERFCEQFGLDYDHVTSFYDEIDFFPSVKYFPGVIGGHCVMSNIEILRSVLQSDMLDAMVTSNEMKKSSLKGEGHPTKTAPESAV